MLRLGGERGRRGRVGGKVSRREASRERLWSVTGKKNEEREIRKKSTRWDKPRASTSAKTWTTLEYENTTITHFLVSDLFHFKPLNPRESTLLITSCHAYLSLSSTIRLYISFLVKLQRRCHDGTNHLNFCWTWSSVSEWERERKRERMMCVCERECVGWWLWKGYLGACRVAILMSMNPWINVFTSSNITK